ncbi:hypothetical protein JL09_g5298, partial [Pichia kudriavzevii]
MAKKVHYGKAGGQFVDEFEPNGTPEGVIEDVIDNSMASIENEKSKRKRKLKEKLIEEHKEKITRKKKKRLDKYIEHQMKREEKEILLKKLEETKIDTSILKSAKLIGSGDRKTKKEKIIEAMELERLGKSTDETKELLYEQREVKNWSDLLQEDQNIEGEPANEEFKSTSTTSSGFIDFRPAQPFSGMGTGFGFSNIEKVVKKKKKKNYSWRNKIEEETSKRKTEEDEMDFESDSSDEELEAQSGAESEDIDVNEEPSKDGKIENVTDEKSDTDSDSDGVEEENNSSVDGDDNDDDDGEDEESEDDVEVEVNIKKEHTKKALDFKEWAEEQVRKLEGREAFSAPQGPQMNYKAIVREEDLDDGLKEDFVPINENLKRKIVTVNVVRDASIQEARSKLPVYAEESRIMEAIHHNDCVIICGETGSGKTTQVPQFLFESGYG